MPDPHLNAPLAPFGGEPPPAPEWFLRALSHAPKRGFVTVEGAKIEVLTWEPRQTASKPALLLLHGSGAHADWWSFIAPFLARDRRVVAFSWSGMGGSDWRVRYSRALFQREAMAVAAASGLFQGAPPILVGHSFGGRLALALTAAHGDKFRAAVIVDPPVFAPDRRGLPGRGDREFKPHRVYPTFAAAMARFRFAPVQSCANLFIADHIARLGLREAREDEGKGWTWRFDSFLWRDLQREDPAPILRAIKRPVALIRGGASKLMRAEDAAYMTSLLAPGSPYFEIAEADHHVMVDQPLAFVAGLEGLLAGWPG
ncbi:MAG: alpha/beta hydrolase [Roseiarcus sp.]|jgi:pimeloyl-ACP methyl ester carboxylesterase